MSLIKPVRAMQLNKSHPLSRGLSACWLFNEGCGEQLSDLSGNRFNIPVAGGTPEWTSGQNGSAMYFNNNQTEYLELDASPVTSIPCTILAWICPDSITEGNYYYPLYIANKNTTDQAWGLLLNYINDGEVSLITNILVPGRAVSSKCISAGQWHQIAGVIASPTDRRCFVDGGNMGTNSVFSGTPSGLNRISIGRAGDSTPGYYYSGKIGCVFVWNRALTKSEIAWLYREPYVMFDTDDRSKSLSFSVGINSLSGSINIQSLISGKIITTNKNNELDKFWLKDSLFNSMTGNSFKLGTALSMSWFWMRRSECNALYRGKSIEQIDFEKILKLVESDIENISPPTFSEHESGTSYYYLIRSINTCGVVEQTIRAIVKVSLDLNGNIESSKPGTIFTSSAEVIDGNKVRLEWFYCPLEQKTIPAYFNIYFDNGSGLIDYENIIAKVEYISRNIYNYISQPLDSKTYLFVIRAVNEDGIENTSSKQTKVQISNKCYSSIDIIDIKKA